VAIPILHAAARARRVMAQRSIPHPAAGIQRSVLVKPPDPAHALPGRRRSGRLRTPSARDAVPRPLLPVYFVAGQTTTAAVSWYFVALSDRHHPPAASSPTMEMGRW